jgi:phenylalanine-4-hydroxylase
MNNKTEELGELRSAFDKAADNALDPRCIPVKLDGPPPVGDQIPYPDYSADEHEIWKILFARQQELLVGRGCQEYMDGLKIMGFPEDRIPSLADCSRILEKTVSWRVSRTPGLLHEEDFFSQLGNRVFPSTDYIRTREELDYTPAPDMFHDVFGHMPMITNPVFANFYQKIGQAAMAAQGDDRRRLERIYWFTVEFGLINTAEGMQIYGNGIISSFAEVQHSLTDKVKKLPFVPEVIAEQEYDVWHMQPLLYVIDSFEQLEDGFTEWAVGKGLLEG